MNTAKTVTCTGESLLPFLHGLLSFRVEKDGLIPLRFTEKQMNVYRQDDRFSVRSFASAGIRFSAYTDARELRAVCRFFPGSSQDLYGLDLLVNGRLAGHREGKISESGTEEIVFALPEGEKTAELYFPCLAGTVILSVSLAGCTAAEPVCREKLLLFAGDSITQGYIAHFPSGTWVSLLARSLGADFVNQGIGGDTFRPETADCVTVSGALPDAVISAYGTNDWNTKEKGLLLSEAAQWFTAVRRLYPDTPIYALTPIWRPDEGKTVASGLSLDEWRRELARIARQYANAAVIPGERLFPPVPELFEDLVIHPGDLGFAQYAERLIPYIRL